MTSGSVKGLGVLGERHAFALDTLENTGRQDDLIALTITAVIMMLAAVSLIVQ